MSFCINKWVFIFISLIFLNRFDHQSCQTIPSERVYSIRTTTREQTTPLLLHLLLRSHGCLDKPPYTALPTPGSTIARFVILPQFYFSSDNLSVPCHRLLFSEIRLPSPFCLWHTVQVSTSAQWQRWVLRKKEKMNVLKLQRYVSPCRAAVVLCWVPTLYCTSQCLVVF